VCAWQSACGGLLPAVVREMGLASTLFFGWIACIAGLVCAVSGERVGGLGKVEARELEPSQAQHQKALETLFVSDLADDRHELRFARDSRYVSDVSATVLEIRTGRALGNFGDLNAWSANRRHCSRLGFRSNRAQTSDGPFSIGRNSC